MILTKADASTSDVQVEKLTRECNFHYRACIVSLVYLLYTRLDLSFVVHKLEKCTSNKYILKDWYICWDTLGTIKLWY